MRLGFLGKSVLHRYGQGYFYSVSRLSSRAPTSAKTSRKMSRSFWVNHADDCHPPKSNGFPILTWSKVWIYWTSCVQWYIERPASFWYYYIVPLRDLVFNLVIDKIYTLHKFTNLSNNWLHYGDEVTWPVAATINCHWQPKETNPTHCSDWSLSEEVNHHILPASNAGKDRLRHWLQVLLVRGSWIGFQYLHGEVMIRSFHVMSYSCTCIHLVLYRVY